MWNDVVDLSAFYASPLGQTARQAIGLQLREIWPDLQGRQLLGLGYATPYLAPFRAEASQSSSGEKGLHVASGGEVSRLGTATRSGSGISSRCASSSQSRAAESTSDRSGTSPVGTNFDSTFWSAPPWPNTNGASASHGSNFKSRPARSAHCFNVSRDQLRSKMLLSKSLFGGSSYPRFLLGQLEAKVRVWPDLCV